jgi:Cysteine-rich CWC
MTPLPHPACPLCGRPNECAVARCGSFDVACWCSSVKVSRASLSLLQADDRGRACLCRQCAHAPPAVSREAEGEGTAAQGR